MYSIGKLARISQTTVRTLRYYDEISILKPTDVTKGGHRYYSEEAITKLHYILTLKEIGFELTEIKDIISNKEKSPKELLKMRLDMITSEIQKLEQSKRTIQGAVQIIEFGGHKDWEDLFRTFKQSYVNKEDITKNRETYFSEEELQKLQKLPRVDQDTNHIKSWITLLNDVREAIDYGDTPQSDKGQQLAHRWLDLVYEMYDGDRELAQKTWNIQNEDLAGVGLVNIEKRIVDFIDAALEFSWVRTGEVDE